jgi:Ca-activated chloride channel family protein
MVTVGVRVSDSNGREIQGLKAERFSLYEDGVPQPIAFFAEEEQPVSVGVLLDRSSSMSEGGKLMRAKGAAARLVQTGHPENEYLYLAFDETPRLIEDFTQDRARLEAAIAATGLGGGTALYDSIVAALDRFKSARYGRQILVAITDGTDQNSLKKLEDVIDALQRSQVQLFLLGYFSDFEDSLFRNGKEKLTMVGGITFDNPRFAFKRLAQETGAESFFPRSDQELRDAAEQVTADVRHQYTLAYYPTRPFEDDQYRRIQVRIDARGVRVRARPGYRPGH